jgi:hypothetical protein
MADRDLVMPLQVACIELVRSEGTSTYEHFDVRRVQNYVQAIAAGVAESVAENLTALAKAEALKQAAGR